MAGFIYDGERFARVDLDDVTLGELIWCEKALKASLSDWTNGEEAAAMAVLSLRRAGKRNADGALITMDDALGLRFADIETAPDEPDPSQPSPAIVATGSMNDSGTSTSSD